MKVVTTAARRSPLGVVIVHGHLADSADVRLLVVGSIVRRGIPAIPRAARHFPGSTARLATETKKTSDEDKKFSAIGSMNKDKASVKRGKRSKPLQDHMEEDMRRMVGNFRALKWSHPTSDKDLYNKWLNLKDLQKDLCALNDMYESLLKQPSSVFLNCRDDLSTLDDVVIETFRAFAKAYEVSGSCIGRRENDFIAK